MPNVLTASYRTTTYKNVRKGFAFPQQLYDAFRFHRGSKVALLVTEPSGKAIFCGISKFSSGPEITEAAVVKHLGRGQEIQVTASRGD